MTFDINGGIITPWEKSRQYTYGQKYNLFVTDWGNRNGKEMGVYPWWIFGRDYLIGWFDKPTGGNQFKENDICYLTRDTTFYAHWKPIISKVTYKLDGGTYNGSTEDPTFEYILTDGVGNTAFGSVPKAHRTGMKFLDWRTIPDDRVAFDELVPHSVWPYQRAEWLRSDKYYTWELYGDYQKPFIDRYRIVDASFVPPFRTGGSDDPNYIPYYYTEHEDDPQYMRWYNGFGGQGDIAVFANWERYEVILDHQGGQILWQTPAYYANPPTSKVRVAYGEKLPVAASGRFIEGIYDCPQTLCKQGYTFHGYFELPNGEGTQYYAPSDDPDWPLMRCCVPVAPWNHTKGGTIYAYFTKNPAPPIVVTFDAKGGTVSPKSKIVEEGRKYGDLPVPEYQGWGFLGWTATSGRLDYVTKDTVVTKTSSHSIYACWQDGKTYNITYFLNGGKINSGLVKTYTFHYGATLPTDVTLTGHNFQGWYANPSFTGSAIRVIGSKEYGDKVFYAKWTAKTYTVTFNPNSGTVTPSTKSVTYGQSYGELPTPLKAGYSFVGWFTSTTGGQQILDSTMCLLNGAQTLYARWSKEPEPPPPEPPTPWTIVKYKIKFETNGGTIAESYGEWKYIKGIAKLLPTADEVTKTGCSFGGWYSKADFSGEVQTEIPATAKSSKTFYAKWVT